MTISTRLAGALACGLTLAATPAAAQNREHQQQAAELRILQEQQQQLTLALAQLAEAIKTINGRLDEAAAANRRGFADQELSIRGLGSDLSAIRERTQETDTRIRTLRDEIDALRTTLASLPSLLSQTAPPPSADPADPNAVPPAGAAPAAVQPPAATAPPSTAGLSPTRMLESAKSDYFAGQWSLALSGFDALLRTFPRSEPAAEAQFYIGETYYAQTKWPEAIDAYGLVLQNHRTSGSVPDAYFKRGRAYAQTGQTDAARAAWEAVMKAYPDSDAARLAKQDLERINRASPPASPPAPAPR
jgi:tol-pal system protein YbgF